MKTNSKKFITAYAVIALVLCLALAAVFLPVSVDSAKADGTAEITYNNYLPAAAPVFDKAGGVYYSDDVNGENVTWGNGSSARLGSVEITTAEDGADIYYTLDGSVPTTASTKYSGGGLTLNKGAHRVRAVAYKNGKYSDVTEKVYVIGSENYAHVSELSLSTGRTDETFVNVHGGQSFTFEQAKEVVIGTVCGSGNRSTVCFSCEYIQLDLGEAKAVNYVTFASFWDFLDIGDKVWMNRIEIGDGESFTEFWSASVGSTPLTSSGYVTENTPKNGQTPMSLTVFSDNAVTGRYIRFYNKKSDGIGDLHTQFITAAYVETKPEEVSAEAVVKPVPMPEETEVIKTYTAHVSKSQIIQDLSEEFKINVGGSKTALTWDSSDFVADTDGTYTFTGTLASVPQGYTDLYKVAVNATVTVKSVNDLTYNVETEKFNNFIAEAAPVFGKKSGMYYSDDANGENVTWGDGSSARLGNVEITTAAEDAKIYYTLDGSVPTNKSTEYTAPLTFGQGAHTVRAVAYKDGKYSEVSKAVYYVGSENYMNSGATLTGNDGWNKAVGQLTGFGGGDFGILQGCVVGTEQNNLYGRYGRIFTDAVAGSGSTGFEYLQVTLSRPQKINQLTFNSYLPYSHDAPSSDLVYWMELGKIEIGDETGGFKTVWTNGGDTYGKDGYVDENSALIGGNVMNLTIFLDEAVTGQCIRYYPTKNALGINYVTAAYFETTPAEYDGDVKQYLPSYSGESVRKAYNTEKTSLEILSDLNTEHASASFGGNNYRLEWYAPSDFDGVYGGTFTFIGLPQGIPESITDLYNVALVAEVSVPVKTNPTKLQAYINGLNVQPQDKYTSSSWATYSGSLNTAREILSALEADENSKTQTQVDDALAALTASVNELELLGDKTALTAKINEVKDTVLTSYTQASGEAFTAKLTAAQSVAASDDVTQADVDSALSDLTAAYSALALKADLTALNARISELENISTEGKTPESVAEFNAALNAAKGVASSVDPSQEEADAALTNLNAAYSGLTDLSDKTALNSSLTDARAEKEKNIYTSASIAALTEAIDSAEEVARNVNATQAQVDEATRELENVIAQLEKLGDRTALKGALDTLEEESDKYTASSWNKFYGGEMRNLLEVAADTDASEADVAAAMELLETEKAKLVLRADTALLLEKLGTSLDASEYTASSWLIYVSARNNALEVVADADAVQSDADSALSALTSAINGLKKLGDKTELNALISEAKGKKQTDSLKKAIADAEAIAADTQASEDDVDSAIAALREAMNKKSGCGSSASSAAAVPAVVLIALALCAIIRRRKLA